MIRNSKLHDDLVQECRHSTSDESIKALMNGIADRIAACRENPVKPSDLMSILRENSTQMSNTILRRRKDI